MSYPKVMGCPCAPIHERNVSGFFSKNIGGKGYTVAVNAEKVLKYQSDVELQNIVDGSLLPYPDGAGAVLGLKWLHGLRSEKINMPILSLEYAHQNNVKTFIVGASDEVHSAAMEVIGKRYPNIDLVGNMHGFSSKEAIVDRICAARPELILLALGSPRQERFAAELLESIDSGIIIGCGGALDIIAGKIKRAPKFWIDNNLEWAYRLIQEPWRLRRQLFLPKFLLGLLVEVLRRGFSRS
jgi:N-acetylglucosaminyldiphosphoundecaprenol N-acetyl-beta-D-mannosaminyltransferase